MIAIAIVFNGHMEYAMCVIFIRFGVSTIMAIPYIFNFLKLIVDF